MRFAVAALMAAPLLAQTTAMLRTGLGSGVVSNCTNATPIVCTIPSTTGLVDNNRVIIENVLGNTAANGSFYIDVLDGTTFALYSASGPTSAVSGNGAWIAGSNLKLAGKATPYALVDHPRIFFNGPTATRTLRFRCWTGCLTNIVVAAGVATANITGYNPSLSLSAGKTIGVWRSATGTLNGAKTVLTATSTTITWTDASTASGTYTDASISEYAWTGNPAWDQLVAGDNSFNSTYTAPKAGGQFLEPFRNAALRWWIVGNAASLTRAMWIIDHPEAITQGTLACDESTGICGGAGREQLDYGRWGLSNVAVAYTLIRDQLTSGQKTDFAAKMFNDPMIAACSYVPTVSQSGTISISGTTVTGSGTSFNSLAQGGAIWIAGNRTIPQVITAIASDTSMTINETASASSSTWEYSRPWQAGDCGAVAVLKHHNASTIGDPSIYPSSGGLFTADGGTGMAEFANLAETGLIGFAHIGAAMADDDARAIRLLQGALLFIYDYNLAYDLKTFTGMGHLGGGYGLTRGAMNPNMCALFTETFVGFPDLGCSVFESWLQSMVYSWGGVPTTTGTGIHARLGLGGAAVDGAYFLGEGTAQHARAATTTWQSYWRQWLIDSGTWVAGVLGYSQSKATGAYLLGVDPQIVPASYASLPLAKLFNQTGYATCSSLGMAKCIDGVNSASHRYDHYMSRSSWSNPSTLAILYGGTTAIDHFGYAHASELYLTRGNNVLLASTGNDHSAGGSRGLDEMTAPHLGTIRFGEANTTRPIATIPRSKTAAGVAYAMTDHAGAWVTTPTGAHRHMVHIGEYAITYDYIANAAAGVQVVAAYAQNSESGEGSSALASGKVTSQSPAETLLTRFHTPGGASTMRLAADTGVTKIYRVKACPSSDGGTTCNAAATNFELITGHRVVGGLADTALTSNAFNPDANWTGAEWIGTGTAVVTMWSRAGSAARTSVPAITTTVTAPYFAAGLAPGTYDVLLGGTPVCAGIVVGASDNAVFCSSVGAGAVSVASTSSPPPASSGSQPRGGRVRGGRIR